MGKETKDTKQLKEYIKKQIDELENKDSFGLDSLLNLIKSTASIDLIKECVEEGNCFGVPNSSMLIPILIQETKDIEYIKHCIENYEKYGISHSGLIQLIENTDDIKYIEECIDNYEKFKMLDYDLIKLLDYIKDEEYIKQCIENFEKFHLTGYNVVELVQNIDDDEFLKKCIDMHEELELNSNSVRFILCEMKDNSNTRDYIFKNKEIGLDSADTVKVIQHTGDEDFMKECIYANKELGLKSYDIYFLIKGLNDSKFLKKCVEKYKDYGLNKGDIKKLIIKTNDVKYVTETLLKNKNDLKVTDADILETISIMRIYNDVNVTDKQIEDILKRLEYVKESNRQIKLPKEMTIGIEIETEGIKSKTIMPEIGWNKKIDNTLQHGIEIISPILTGDNDKTTNEIRTTCLKLQKEGQYASERCGGHVHIGADYLDSEKAWENFIEIWGNTEKIIYAISNKEGEAPRKPIAQYAKPISAKLEKNIERDSDINLETEEDLKEFIVDLQNKDRFFAVNFQNLYISDRRPNTFYSDQMEFLDNIEGEMPPVINTVEFRLSNGSIYADTWIDNINLFGGIIKTSKELVQIQEKQEKDLSKEEKEKIQLFERIKQTDIEEKEKMQDLVKLVVAEEDRQIYINRYNENSKLIKEDKFVEDAINNNITTTPIDLKKIGKKVFLGEGCITGMEYEEYCEFLQRQRERQEQEISI